MNQMVFYDKYNDLLVFECKHLRLIIQILFAILDHNRLVNPAEEQQFLCFFEPLLDKVAAVTKFQQAVRRSLFRKRLKDEQLLVSRIIQKRAAFCIQSWWSSLKLRKRAVALANIKKHLAKIQSNELYLEQTIYQNINAVIAAAHQAFRFREQTVMFDFNPASYGVCMQVAEARDVTRYQERSAPVWLDVNIEPPSFPKTSYINSILALFHLNQGDC